MTLKSQIYISIFAFLILISLLIFLFVLPLYNEIKRVSENLILINQKLAFSKERLENIGKLREIEKRIEPFVEKIEKSFVKIEEPIGFINFLEKISQECQVFLQISSPFPKKEVKEIEFQILVASSFSKVFCFLEKLESSNYLIRISGLNFTKLTESDLKIKEFENFSIKDVKANITFKVYGK